MGIEASVCGYTVFSVLEGIKQYIWKLQCPCSGGDRYGLLCRGLAESLLASLRVFSLK